MIEEDVPSLSRCLSPTISSASEFPKPQIRSCDSLIDIVLTRSCENNCLFLFYESIKLFILNGCKISRCNLLYLI